MTRFVVEISPKPSQIILDIVAELLRIGIIMNDILISGHKIIVSCDVRQLSEIFNSKHGFTMAHRELFYEVCIVRAKPSNGFSVARVIAQLRALHIPETKIWLGNTEDHKERVYFECTQKQYEIIEGIESKTFELDEKVSIKK